MIEHFLPFSTMLSSQNPSYYSFDKVYFCYVLQAAILSCFPPRQLVYNMKRRIAYINLLFDIVFFLNAMNIEHLDSHEPLVFQTGGDGN